MRRFNTGYEYVKYQLAIMKLPLVQLLVMGVFIGRSLLLKMIRLNKNVENDLIS